MKASLFAAPALLLALLACFSSCKPQEEKPVIEKIPLKTPEPKFVEAGSTWATLTWAPIEGALNYNIWFEGEEKPDMAIDTLFTLQGLEQNTDYRITVTAEAATQGNYKSSAKSAVIAFKTSSKPTLESPQVIIDSLISTAFDAHWNTVPMAADYTYIFQNGAPVITVDTTFSFSDLTPGRSYTFQVRANPSEEYAEEYDPSQWCTMKIDAPVPDTLTAPVINVERASCIHTTISWEEVKNATGYRYVLGDGDTVTTTSLSTYFEGLVQDADYTFKIQAVCDNPEVAVNSKWASAQFKAVDDFETTLTVTGVSATDNSVTFTGKITKEGETFVMGVFPKADLLDASDNSKVDTAAIIGLIEADSSRELYNTSTTKTFDNLCQGTTYICCALSIDSKGTVKSALQAADAKVKEFEAVTTGTNYNTGDFAKIITAHSYGYSSSVGIYGPTDYLGFKISNEMKDTRTLAEVKYSLWTASAFETKFGGTTSATAGAIKDYFETSGSSMSQANLDKVNAGTAYSAGYTSRSANTAYTMAMRAVTTDNDTLICVSTILTYKEGSDWLTLIPDASGSVKVTIKSALPLVSAKYAMVKLSASNNTPELIKAYTLSNSLTDANIAAINEGTGTTKSYASLTAATTYNFIIRAVNAAGDEITRNILIRTN